MIRNHRIRDHYVMSIFILTYSLPIIGDLILNGWERVFSYFAADAFFYFTVARNFSKLGFFSFDGVYPTNGFHPLWQLILGIYYIFANLLNFSEILILVGIFILCMIIVVFALYFLASGLKNIYDHIPISAVFLILGVYPIIVAVWEARFGTIWSFTNGMETPLLILSFCFLFFLISHERYQFNNSKHMCILGLLLGLIFLSRLDHGLFAVSLYGVIFLQIIVRKNYSSIRYLIYSGSIFFLVVASYLILNRLSSDMWIPVSGSLKSSFPRPDQVLIKIREIISLIQRYHDIDFGWWIWRYLQIIIPQLFAIPMAIHTSYNIFKNKASRKILIFSAISFFIIIFGLYNFAFVPIFAQGHWYFPISIIFSTIFTIEYLHNYPMNTKKWGWLLGVTMLSLVFFINFFWNDSHNDLHRQLFLNTPEIIGDFNSDEIKMVEYDDGIITYSTKIQALSGFGFCLDREAADALRSGILLDLAYDRGYRYITSLYYFGGRFGYSTPSQTIKDYFYLRKDMIGQYDLESYYFEVIYQSLDGNFLIIQMAKSID